MGVRGGGGRVRVGDGGLGSELHVGRGVRRPGGCVHGPGGRGHEPETGVETQVSDGGLQVLGCLFYCLLLQLITLVHH